jgi:hypothetical protein
MKPARIALPTFPKSDNTTKPCKEVRASCDDWQ